MKKFSLFIILCIFILSISTPQKTYAINIKDISSEQITVKLLDEKTIQFRTHMLHYTRYLMGSF